MLFLSCNSREQDLRQLRELCRSLRLSTKGNKADLASRLRALSERQNEWKNHLGTGARRQHRRGPQVKGKKTAAKASVKRRETLFGSNGMNQQIAGSSSGVPTQLMTERFIDTRSPQQKAFLLLTVTTPLTGNDSGIEPDRTLKLGNGTVLSFKLSTVPTAPSADLAKNIPRLAKMWDDTLPGWNPSLGLLYIHGHPIALKYWPDVYKYPPRGQVNRWNPVKRVYLNWKTVALCWHQMGAKSIAELKLPNQEGPELDLQVGLGSLVIEEEKYFSDNFIDLPGRINTLASGSHSFIPWILGPFSYLPNLLVSLAFKVADFLIMTVSRYAPLPAAIIHTDNLRRVRIDLPPGVVLNINLPKLWISHPLYWRWSKGVNDDGKRQYSVLTPAMFREYLLFSHSLSTNAKSYSWGVPFGYEDFATMFNNQDIDEKLVEWNHASKEFFWPENGIRITKSMIDLEPYGHCAVPVIYPELVTLLFQRIDGSLNIERIISLANQAVKSLTETISQNPPVPYSDNPNPRRSHFPYRRAENRYNPIQEGNRVRNVGAPLASTLPVKNRGRVLAQNAATYEEHHVPSPAAPFASIPRPPAAASSRPGHTNSAFSSQTIPLAPPPSLSNPAVAIQGPVSNPSIQQPDPAHFSQALTQSISNAFEPSSHQPHVPPVATINPQHLVGDPTIPNTSTRERGGHKNIGVRSESRAGAQAELDSENGSLTGIESVSHGNGTGGAVQQDGSMQVDEHGLFDFTD
ncbi:hypothetical protein AN958_02534 [Leucoagaricus sp. SymC.cos]|nr:hypothetical protein AN958_02534 [Leucoagaricus sp. SymC.cos]